jgi:hypothetical protein
LIALVKDIEAAKAFNFIAYHAFIGFWNRECASMERLGIGFDFNMDRLGLQIIEELDPESIRAQRYLYHFLMMSASTLMVISGT